MKKVDKAGLRAAIAAAQREGRVQPAYPLSLKGMSAELHRMGIVIAPGTLWFYMPFPPETPNPNQRHPVMDGAYQVDGRWQADLADVVKWAAAYKAAPKRGRRGGVRK